jgi:hypothetical protein
MNHTYYTHWGIATWSFLGFSTCGFSCLNFECNIAQHATSTIIANFSFEPRMDFTGDIFNLQGLNKVGKPHLSNFLTFH